jgi:hypothetical protein
VLSGVKLDENIRAARLSAPPPLALTFTADGLAPSRLATFALGDKVAMPLHVAHDAIFGNARAKATEQAVECLAVASFNFGHFFITLIYLWPPTPLSF